MNKVAPCTAKPLTIQLSARCSSPTRSDTLVKRVTSLISQGVDPATILILTFSNRAAGELAERIAAAVPQAAPRIWIGTFHAFGLDLVRRYHDRLGLSPNPTLFDRSDA